MKKKFSRGLFSLEICGALLNRPVCSLISGLFERSRQRGADGEAL